MIKNIGKNNYRSFIILNKDTIHQTKGRKILMSNKTSFLELFLELTITF
jgi:hypothetical protein